MQETLQLLKPFEEATHELSSSHYISISKVIQLARSLQRLTCQSSSTLVLKTELLANMAKRFINM